MNSQAMGPDAARSALKVLLVEDAPDDAALIEATLQRRGTQLLTSRVATRDGMRRALAESSWDVVVSDYSLPGFTAMEAISLIKESGQEVPLIVVSGFLGDELAVALIKEGVADFVPKSSLARLGEAVDRCVREMHTRREHAAAVRALERSEVRYKTLVANLPSLVFQWVLTPRGPSAWLYLSKPSESLLGVPQERLEAVPGAFVDLIHEEDRYRFLQACKNVMGGGVLMWGGRLHSPHKSEPAWIELRALVRRGNSGDCLADGIIDDVSVRKRFELELLASRAQLRELSGHLDEAKEQERATIAREIHDELGGLLTAAKIELATLANQLPSDRADLAATAHSSEALIDQAMDMSRRIARRLRPAVLDHGIVPAIEWQAREFSKRMGIPCDVAVETEDIDIEPQRSTAVFRVLQEALTNVARHAHARHVNVELELPSGNQVVLRVLDDGVGIAAKDARKPASFGIRGMRERAESLGGTLRVGPARGGGTEVSLMIPLSRGTGRGAPRTPQART